jgi:hypothetical protein
MYRQNTLLSWPAPADLLPHERLEPALQEAQHLLPGEFEVLLRRFGGIEAQTGGSRDTGMQNEHVAGGLVEGQRPVLAAKMLLLGP